MVAGTGHSVHRDRPTRAGGRPPCRSPRASRWTPRRRTNGFSTPPRACSTKGARSPSASTNSRRKRASQGHALPALRLQGGARRRVPAPAQRPRLRLAARGLGRPGRASRVLLSSTRSASGSPTRRSTAALVNGAIEARGAQTEARAIAAGHLDRHLGLLGDREARRWRASCSCSSRARRPWRSSATTRSGRRRAGRGGSALEQAARGPERARRAVRAQLARGQRAARVQPARDDVDPVRRSARAARRRRAARGPRAAAVEPLSTRTCQGSASGNSHCTTNGPARRGAVVDGAARRDVEQQLHRRRVARRGAVGRADEAGAQHRQAVLGALARRTSPAGTPTGPGSASSGSPAARSFCSKERAPSV